MGNLFGGGNRRPAPTTSTPGSALQEDPRPMPDPYSPIARRRESRTRAQVSQRSGRVSTDLTGAQRRRRDEMPNVAMLG